MKEIIRILRFVIAVIAWFVFASGIVLAGIGIYDFFMVFFALAKGSDHTTSLMVIGLLHAVDIFLVAIVFFVLALGFFVLFANQDSELPVKLPGWLHVKNFTQLKIILWEAILTTLVVSWLAGLVEVKIAGEKIGIQSLIIPAGVLVIALSLFFLKKGEQANH